MKEKGKNFTWTITTLKPLVKRKMLSPLYVKPKDKKNDPVPTKKDLLLKKYKQVKDLRSPEVSPCNSEAEEGYEGDQVNSDSESEGSTAGLEFDSDESDSDDEAQSDDEDE